MTDRAPKSRAKGATVFQGPATVELGGPLAAHEEASKSRMSTVITRLATKTYREEVIASSDSRGKWNKNVKKKTTLILTGKKRKKYKERGKKYKLSS